MSSIKQALSNFPVTEKSLLWQQALDEACDALTQKKMTEAADCCDKALSLASNDAERAFVFLTQAAVQSASGQFSEETVLVWKALEHFDKSVGPLSTHTFAAVNKLVEINTGQHKYSAVEFLQKRICDIVDHNEGQFSPHLAACLIDLGETQIRLSAYGEAEKTLDKAFAILDSEFGRYVMLLDECSAGGEKQESAKDAGTKASIRRYMGWLLGLMAGVWTSVSTIHLRQGNSEAAEAAYAKALKFQAESKGYPE